jgi:hypothetical protein
VPSDDVKWGSVPGLRNAAIRIEAEAGRFDRIVGNLYSKVNNTIVNPETFGDDKGGKEFFAKWDKDFRDWDTGVRAVSGSVKATAHGVDAMADAYEQTDKNTKLMADGLGNYVNGGGSGGGGSNIPPLPAPPNPGGNNGGGNTGGHNVRH